MKRIIMAALAGLALAGSVADAQPVDRRQARQHARIEHGIATGRVTPYEASRLHRQQRSIHRQESRMRYRNGGPLTRRDRAVLRDRQRHASRNIHRARHNYRRY